MVSERRSPVLVAISRISSTKRVDALLLHSQPPGVIELQQAREDPERRSLLVLRQLVGQLRDFRPEAHGVPWVGIAGPVGGSGVPPRCLQRLATLLEMLGDQCGQLFVALGVELDQSLRRRGVCPGALLAELGAVSDLLRERMAERENALRVDLVLVEEPSPDQLLQPLRERERRRRRRRFSALAPGPPCRSPMRPAAAPWRSRGGRCAPRGSPARSPERPCLRPAWSAGMRRGPRPGSRPRPAHGQPPR